MVETPTGDRPGAQFGKYRIVRKLGEGAFGAVYEAVLPGPMGFTKRVAIKKLRSSLVAGDPSFVQSMVNEARIGGLLHHGNIVDVAEFEQVDEHYYLAMEYVDGLTLDEIVRICRHNETLLPRFATIKIGTDVCRGLHYAHQFKDVDGQPLNLIHRDLKPSNIIVNIEGTAKILDFGIAKAASNLYNTTSTSVSKGTPRYMSPEQMMCDGPLTYRSDIFSMGVVLFELVTGRVLFDAPSLPALAMKIVSEIPEADLDEAEVALPGCRAVLARALQKDPLDRFEDAQAMAGALLELGHRYPPQADMAEVISRLLPGRDPTDQQVIRNSGELNLATQGTTDGILPPLSEQNHIAPASPSSAGWDRFTEVFDTMASPAAAPEVPAPANEDPTRPIRGFRTPGPDDATAAIAPPGLAQLDAIQDPGGGSRRWIVRAVGALVVVLLAVGGGVVLGQLGQEGAAGSEATPGETTPDPTRAQDAVTASVVAEEATAAPLVDAETGTSEPTPEPATPAAAGVAVELVTEAVAEVTPELVTQQPEEPTPAPTAARPGTVSIRCKPWSRIYVDGALVKESVILKDHDVGGGHHVVRLVCPEQGDAEKTFSVDIDGQDVGLGCWDFTADAPCGG